MALYFVSGQEYLLAVAVLIVGDVFYQRIPYVRIDGYWALADLTGIPDFFSQMGPFLRSVLLIPGSNGSKLPSLKPWVKAVFAIYIIFTVPVLALFFFLMVISAPYFIAISWDALLSQTRLFSMAQSSGEFILMAASASQMLLITLSMLAIVYMLYSMSRKPIRVLWNWSKPTPMRRMAGALATSGTVALLALLWTP
jgi:hypothetical protein